MNLSILDSINYGYGHLEPMIIGLMAMNRNFLLIGRHGAGKSRLAKVLSQGYGKQGFVFYDATKDDLISIAGIPNPEAIKNGKLDFTPHQRSIWDKSTVVVDEITRASKENQNLWLEILEERTCFGKPLSYRSLIATANPESYAAAFRLDEALLDRFHAVIPIPELQENMGLKELETIMGLALNPRPKVEAETIARLFSEIQAAYKDLHSSGAMEKVIAYASRIVSELLQTQLQKTEDERIYVSPRTYSRTFPESLMAAAAYYKVAGIEEPLQAAAMDAVRYGLATKYRLNEQHLLQLHNSAKNLLKDGDVPEVDKLRYAIVSLRSFEERLEYLQDNRDKIKEHLKKDELEKFLGAMLQGASKDGEKEKLVHLRTELEVFGYEGDLLRQIDGNLILTLNSAISTFIPLLSNINIKAGGKNANVWNQIEQFKGLVEAGRFINNSHPDVRKLQTFLIDVYEEDLKPDPQTIISIFSELNLPEAVENHG